ncbi:putative repeat protein (TIGR02543 family) [Breznakia blatticola]|uniref:Putative repeat protein (TIGR02543 family) n=1 Tax=Breznakia blatticola TaxID=1754012 RepID=A0A4R7ZSF0_9FIRM|nr:InlB B-repeat-containing protein [Breznakia blatticola]TDW19801.1 putative repeat protein (TIGR02543 family) [Breznakia blatticola]
MLKRNKKFLVLLIAVMFITSTGFTDEVQPNEINEPIEDEQTTYEEKVLEDEKEDTNVFIVDEENTTQEDVVEKSMNNLTRATDERVIYAQDNIGVEWILYADGELVIHGGTINIITDSSKRYFKQYSDIITSITFAGDVYYTRPDGGLGNYMFADLKNLVTVNNFDRFKLSGDASGLFIACEKLKNIDTTNFATDNITNFTMMFSYCESLEYINVSNWNVDNVTSMWSMFSHCYSLREIDISQWTFKNATDISYVFYRCRELLELDFSSMDPVNEVTKEKMLGSELASSMRNKLRKITLGKTALGANTDIYARDWRELDTGIVHSAKFLDTHDTSKTITYIWDAKHAVFYNPAGGTLTGPAKEEVDVIESSFTKPTDPTHEHATFVRWFTSRWDYDKKELIYEEWDYSSIPVLNMPYTTEVYAEWDYDTYKISYELNGGTISQLYPTEYKYNTEVRGFNTPSKEGYFFLGWYDANEGGNKVTSISSTEFGDKKLYARWSPRMYQITYELDGGTNHDSNPSSYAYDTGVSKLENPTKEGYTFIGWFDDVNEGNQITSIDKKSKEHVTIYARWMANQYAIIYELNGGINDTNNPTSYAYELGVDTFEEPTKYGHTFLGWYDAPEKGNQITNIAKDSIGHKTLYAKWKVNDYKVNYELDGGINSLDNPMQYTYGIGVSEFEKPNKEDYTFIGWFNAAEDGKEITNIDGSTAEDVTLYARWKKNEKPTPPSEEPSKPIEKPNDDKNSNTNITDTNNDKANVNASVAPTFSGTQANAQTPVDTSDSVNRDALLYVGIISLLSIVVLLKRKHSI